MRIELGDHVISRDGHRLGTVKYLVLDPATEQVKKVVVEKGMLLVNDVEFPLDAFVEGDSHGVYVSYSAEQAHLLPHFDLALYTPVEKERLPSFLNYPLGGILWPGSYLGQPFVGSEYPLMAGGFPLVFTDQNSGQQERRSEEISEVASVRKQLDRANAVIAAGDPVVSRDGETIGEVHSVVIDSVTGMPTTLVVRKGHLFIDDTTLMGDSISAVDDGVVTLNMDRQELVKG